MYDRGTSLLHRHGVVARASASSNVHLATPTSVPWTATFQIGQSGLCVIRRAMAGTRRGREPFWCPKAAAVYVLSQAKFANATRSPGHVRRIASCLRGPHSAPARWSVLPRARPVASAEKRVRCKLRRSKAVLPALRCLKTRCATRKRVHRVPQTAAASATAS